MSVAVMFLEAVQDSFLANKHLAERAIEQVDEERLHRALDENTNSIAVIMKHISGNLLSRWTDFLTTDGEKESRNRDDEFVDSFASRQELMDDWNRGWMCLFDALSSLSERDLEKTISIRGVAHSVPLAIERSLGHTCYHIGQIVQIARIHAGENWTTLTIPRGGSKEYNRKHWGESGKSHS